MTSYIRQGTANTVMLGPVVSNLTGLAYNSLAIAPSALYLSKNGGLFAVKGDTNTAYHNRDGYYPVPLNTTDTGTAGRLRLQMTANSVLPVWEDYTVVPGPVYDWLIAGTSTLNVGAIAYANSLPGLNAVATSVWQNPTRTLTALEVPGIGNSVWATPTRALTDKSNFNLAANQGGVTIGTVTDITNAVTVGTNNDKTGYALAPGMENSIWSYPTRELTAIALPGLPASVWNNPTRALTDKDNFNLAADQSGVTIGTVNNVALPGLPSSVWANPTRDLTAIALPGLPSSVWASPTRALTDKADFNLAADQSAVTVGTVTDVTNAVTAGALPAGLANTVWNNPTRELTAIAMPGIGNSVWYYPVTNSLTARDIQRITLAVVAGPSTGGGTVLPRFFAEGVATPVVQGTVDSDGNRLLVILSPAY